ncbi:MAG TPA: glycosyltransferase, partial [Yinghuangia sp.]|nr:glycosyltransferase [Yinghuangia sp.]
HTGAVQYARPAAADLRIRALPELRDIDTPDALTHVVSRAPRTRTVRLGTSPNAAPGRGRHDPGECRPFVGACATGRL